MIIKDVIEKNLEIFHHNHSFYNAFKAVDIAQQYLRFKKGIKLDIARKLRRNELFKRFYFTSLIEAVKQTRKRKKDESIKFYNKRIRRKYYSLRKESYEELLQIYIDDYEAVGSFFKMPALKKKEISKLKLNPTTWMVGE